VPTNLNPKSQTSAIILTSTGSTDDVASAVPFGVYTGSAGFISGASSQVAYTYKKLGGDVVDIELTPSNIYAAYEEAVLEYSYIVNMHQGKNVLSDALGNTTGTFDHKGDLTSGPVSGNLRYPRFQVSYAKKIGDSMAAMAGFGGTIPQYSASFSPKAGVQDYDLYNIISASSATGQNDAGGAVPFSGKVDGKRIIVTKVFYRSPRAMWRFYGYYGGINTVGNASTYGQFADDSTFEVIPTWQNKLQAIMYEDSIYTRTSHFSYEIIDNKLRLYPNPANWNPYGGRDRMWVRFYVEDMDVFTSNSAYRDGVEGVNNLNTLPFDNIPYENINSIGKQWIRKYCLALCKEMLGQIRGKFTTIPIPGESVTLNHSELLSQAKDEQQQLKDKLSEMLKEVEYKELIKYDSESADATQNIFKNSPLPIFVG
tara:strand:+ start:446 stop:1723 length:1278 start_codon:yes stop_codon:yes gene_type:complete